MRKKTKEITPQSSFSVIEECWRHRKLYIIGLSIGTFIAFIVSFLTPKEYASFAKLSDEHIDSDILIGLDAMTAQLRNMEPKDLGTNSPIIYGMILHSKDFLKALAKSRIYDKRCTYQQYLGIKGINACIDAIKTKIKYKIDEKRYIITIRMTDRNPLVAAHLMNSILSLLHHTISQKKGIIIQAQVDQTKKEKDEALEIYQDAQKCYDTYFDAHFETSLPSEKKMITYLNSEKIRTQLLYNKKQEQYNRALALQQKPIYPFSILQSPTVAIKPFRPNVIVYIVTTDIILFIFLSWFILGRKTYQQFLKG